MTNTTQLTWTRPELLADADAWSAKDNAIAVLRERGEDVTNVTVSDFCADAIEFIGKAATPCAARWIKAYRAVRAALEVVS